MTAETELEGRMEAKRILRTIFRREHLLRTGAIALVIGTWLSLFNHGGMIIAGELGRQMSVKLLLNYLTPFVVANLGLLSREEQ